MTIILDTESNGNNPPEICQLAYIAVDSAGVCGRNFFFSINSMNEYAFQVHGLSKRRLFDLSLGRGFSERLEEFGDELLTADMIVGHNISADLAVLRREFHCCGMKFQPCHALCTMKQFEGTMNLHGKTGKRKPPNLRELCVYFGITDTAVQDACAELFSLSDGSRAHDARFDATATYLCIIEAQRRGELKGVL